MGWLTRVAVVVCGLLAAAAGATASAPPDHVMADAVRAARGRLDAPDAAVTPRGAGAAPPLAAAADRQAGGPPTDAPPVLTVPRQEYPVCNAPGGAFSAMIRLYVDTVATRCDEVQPALRRNCTLTTHLCCRDTAVARTSPDVRPPLLACDLASGLCEVWSRDTRAILVGAWKATSCGRAGAPAAPDPDCQCAKTRAAAGDFPTAPCVLLYGADATDADTGLATVNVVDFGPYAVRQLEPSYDTVAPPGGVAPRCVPAQTASVTACGSDDAATASAVLDACAAQAGPVDGSPGQCCLALLTDIFPPGLLACIVGGDCVRIDRGSRGLVVNDWAAGPGCLTGGPTPVPPGGAPARGVCVCAPAAGGVTGDGGCAIPDVPPPAGGDGCVTVDTAAGAAVGGDRGGGLLFEPRLDGCGAPGGVSAAPAVPPPA